LTLSLDETEARVAELLRALIEVAKQRGRDEECAKKTKRAILRAIFQAKIEKLNALRNRQTKEQTREEWGRPDKRWAIHLVRLKSNAHLPRDRAIDDAKATTFADLNATERRAVNILCGNKRKARKNFLELAAEELASAVRSDGWFSVGKSVGRPRGSGLIKGLRQEDLEYYVPLSASDVIRVAMPLIEVLAGASDNDGAKLLVLPALVATVRLVFRSPSRESIARIATRNRAASRKPAHI
jgi:hypothetical protein